MQQQSQQEQSTPSKKSWLLARGQQWLDGTMSNLLTLITGGSLYWVFKHLWGLAFIPFSVLDAVLLSLIVAFVVIFLVTLFIYYIFKYGWRTIGVILGLLVLVSWVAEKRPLKDVIDSKTSEQK